MVKSVYKLSIIISKVIGVWFFIVLAKIIATGFFLFSPGKVKISVGFYTALFPGKSTFYYLWCAMKQFQSFTKIFLHRFMLLDLKDICFNSIGWDQLEKAIDEKEGGIILMSHLGNWEIAAHLMKQRRQDVKFMLFLGKKHKEQIEDMQKERLEEKGIKIVAVDKDGGSPFLLLEGIKWMNEGGLLSMTGDMIWTKEQRSVAVDFLDNKANLPETPHMLALLSGKPLYIMFAIQSAKNHYTIEASEPIYVKAEKRSERKDAVRKSAQTYANLMEQTVRRYPFEWFHFGPFLDKKE